MKVKVFNVNSQYYFNFFNKSLGLSPRDASDTFKKLIKNKINLFNFIQKPFWGNLGVLLFFNFNKRWGSNSCTCVSNRLFY